MRKDNLAVMGEENFHSSPIAFLCEGDGLCEVQVWVICRCGLCAGVGYIVDL